MVKIKIGKNNNIVVEVNLKKFLVSCLIFAMVTGWVFSGWPQIFDFEVGEQEIVFPPKIQQARAAQRAWPDSTPSSTDWTYLGTSFHEAVDEAMPGNGDTDYASTSVDESEIHFGLTDLSVPATNTGHIIRVTAKAPGGGSGGEKIYFHLYEGTTKIGSSLKTTVDRTQYVTHTYTLLPGEADNISVYADLQIWIDVDAVGTNEEIRITHVELEVPDAAAANDDPVVDAVDLSPSPITLTENTTTTVTCTSTISDQQQGNTIISATATIYRSGVTSTFACSANDNNCYQNITPLATSSAGNYFYATFTKDIWFHAEPTDGGAYAIAQGWDGQNWQCYVIAEDDQGATGTSSDSVELNTLSALITASTINYGALAPGATSSASVIITATTTGNIPIDVKLKGQDLVSNGYSFEGDQQEYATSSDVDYGSGIKLATTTYADLELESLKPVQHGPIQATATDIIYWRIEIPADQGFGTYYGTTSVAAKPDT